MKPPPTRWLHRKMCVFAALTGHLQASPADGDEEPAGESAEAIAESVAACADAIFNELPLPLAQHPD